MPHQLDLTSGTPPRALFLITGDPRTSPRPAEGIRIATGVSAWRKSAVHLYLGPAMVDGIRNLHVLQDGDVISENLPDLLNGLSQLLLPSNAGKLSLPESLQGIGTPVAESRLAELMIQCDHVLHF